MKNPFLISAFFFSLAFTPILSAQSICPPNTPPGEDCASACVVCDLNGFSYVNEGTPSSGNTVCGAIVIHNDQWIGFVAGTPSISINVKTANCQNGEGLQIALFESCDAQEAIACNPGFPGGMGQDLVLDYYEFVPGKTYFLMVDGFTADVCDYQIEVLSGSTGPCGDILTACGDDCLTVCDSVFCNEGLNIASCPNDSIYSFYLNRVHPQASIQGGGTITCNTPEIALYAQNPNGDPVWLHNGLIVGNGLEFFASATGKYTLQVTNGTCTDEASILVKQNSSPPPVTAMGGMLDPVTSLLQLKGNSILSGMQYSWVGPGGFSSNLKNPIVNASGAYTLTVTNPQTGCSNSITVQVTN